MMPGCPACSAHRSEWHAEPLETALCKQHETSALTQGGNMREHF